MPRGGIPDRWLLYSKVGKVIDGTPFIAFKVPLKESLNQDLESQEKFTPASLLQEVECLGLVIDLTFTSRYYAPEEFLARGVKHCKILCPGHGTVPSDTEFKSFAEAVDSYLASRTGEEKLVGVHCTHGLNRTGYMICRYLIDNMGFSPEQAVEGFEKARGHFIERSEYLEALGYTPPPGDRPLVTIKSKSKKDYRRRRPSQNHSRQRDIFEYDPSDYHFDDQQHNSHQHIQQQSEMPYHRNPHWGEDVPHAQPGGHHIRDERIRQLREPRPHDYQNYGGGSSGWNRYSRGAHNYEHHSNPGRHRQPFYHNRRNQHGGSQSSSHSASNASYTEDNMEYWDTSQCWF